MNPTSKKLVSLFLIFSLMMLSANLYAKERRGAKLIITKKDGQLIEGELITVKPNSLLLLNTEGKDVSVDIADIKIIKVVKKSMVVWGALGGLLAGEMTGAFLLGLIGLAVKASAGETLSVIVQHAWPAAIVGAIIGGIVGAFGQITQESSHS
jgi:hypothetical protein